MDPEPLLARRSRAAARTSRSRPGSRSSAGISLQVVGPETVVARAASRIGPVIAPTTTTDFVTLGLAIFLGGLVGVLVSFPIGA